MATEYDVEYAVGNDVDVLNVIDERAIDGWVPVCVYPAHLEPALMVTIGEGGRGSLAVSRVNILFLRKKS